MAATLNYMETTNATTPATFQVGQTVSCRMAGDHNMVWLYTVVSRTAKFVTLEGSDGRTVRVGVKMNADGEWALPDGAYSMAPVVRA